jgi:MFS family permease
MLIGQMFLRETLKKPKMNQKIDFHPLAPIRHFFQLPAPVKGLITSRFFSLFAWGIAEMAFVFYAVDIIGLSYLEWGVTNAVGTASFGLFSFLGGKLSDKYGRKRMILCTFVCSTISPFLFMLSADFYQVMAVQVLMGGIGLGRSSVDAYTADHVRKGVRGKAIGTADSMFGASMIMGPAIGGVLYSMAPQLPFLGGVAFGFLAIPLAWKLLK